MALIKLNATRGLEGALPAVSGASLTGVSAGKILQVKQTVRTDTFSTSSTSFTGAGMSVSITPASASNKIFCMFDIVGGPGNNVSMFLRLVRGSTVIHVGDSAGGRYQATAGASDDPSSQFPLQMSGSVLDSPNTTSSTDYYIQMATEGSGNTGTCYINRSAEDSNDNQNGRYASSITVMEVEA